MFQKMLQGGSGSKEVLSANCWNGTFQWGSGTDSVTASDDGFLFGRLAKNDSGSAIIKINGETKFSAQIDANWYKIVIPIKKGQRIDISGVNMHDATMFFSPYTN